MKIVEISVRIRLVPNVWSTILANYRIIASIEELKKFFYHILPVLQDGESFMACLASRNKRLTIEERDELGIRRGCMFHTEVLKKKLDKKVTFENFISFIFKFETDQRAYLTGNNLPFPQKSLILYMYMNPCSEIKVAQDILWYIQNLNNELIKIVMLKILQEKFFLILILIKTL